MSGDDQIAMKRDINAQLNKLRREQRARLERQAQRRVLVVGLLLALVVAALVALGFALWRQEHRAQSGTAHVRQADAQQDGRRRPMPVVAGSTPACLAFYLNGTPGGTAVCAHSCGAGPAYAWTPGWWAETHTLAQGGSTPPRATNVRRMHGIVAGLHWVDSTNPEARSADTLPKPPCADAHPGQRQSRGCVEQDELEHARARVPLPRRTDRVRPDRERRPRRTGWVGAPRLVVGGYACHIGRQDELERPRQALLRAEQDELERGERLQLGGERRMSWSGCCSRWLSAVIRVRT